MTSIRCPVCDVTFERESTPTFPFCSARCKQIDLGRWLGEKYSVTREKPTDEDSSEEAAHESQ